MYDKHAGREQTRLCRDAQQRLAARIVWAVAKGAGIGWLPTYVPALGGPLIPLDLDVKFDSISGSPIIPTRRGSRGSSNLIDWTIQSFDGRKYPWFRDEFVHPNDLQKAYKDAEPLVNLFAGFKKVSRTKIRPSRDDR